MVVKAAKNLYYHFFIKCGKIIKKKKIKTAEKHKIQCIFRRFYLFRALSLFLGRARPW